MNCSSSKLQGSTIHAVSVGQQLPPCDPVKEKSQYQHEQTLFKGEREREEEPGKLTKDVVELQKSIVQRGGWEEEQKGDEEEKQEIC